MEAGRVRLSSAATAGMWEVGSGKGKLEVEGGTVIEIEAQMLSCRAF